MRVLLNATDGPLSLRALRRYVTEMAAGLARPGSGVDLKLVFFTHRLLRVRAFLRQLPPDSVFRFRVVPLPRALLTQRYAHSRRELRALTKNVDLYHETTFDSPAVPDVPCVTTVHGLCPWIRPDLLDPYYVRGMQQWMSRALEHSQYFAPVSETSRDEFLARFDVSPDRVRAVPLGVSRTFYPVPRVQARNDSSKVLGWSDPYLLYVGGIQRNKNIDVLLRCFQRLRESQRFEGQLVLAGDLHYPLDEFRHRIEELGIAAQVHLMGCLDPDDPRLAMLYRGASLFLFPTLYEGWTSPPLEAMACGTPVITSNASSLPETVADAALTIEPTDECAWAEAAAAVLDDSGLRRRLRHAGLERAALFPWSRTVATMVDFYHAIGRAGFPSQLRATTRATGSTPVTA
ncbi:MAG: glycosyltransferase family 4 protein [Planctomycetota bacterium]